MDDPSVAFMVCVGLLTMAVMANIEKRRELCVWILLATCLLMLIPT